MRKLKSMIKREEGIAMATVVMMIAVLTLLGVVLIDQVTAESNRSAAAMRTDAVYQAAEAGLNDYIAKLVDDSQFYDHFVGLGEATRQGADGSTGDPGDAWTSGVTWSYPNGKDVWIKGADAPSLLEGYAYNIMVSPPSVAAERNYATIVSTGCKLDAAGTACDAKYAQRSIEIRTRRTTPADFFSMYNESQNFGTGYTNYGKIYVNGDVDHDGVARGDVMAEGQVTDYPSLQDGAQVYDRDSNPNIRFAVKNPVTFSYFNVSLADIKTSAQLNGAYYNQSGIRWAFVFTADGKYELRRCTGGSETSAPSGCTTVTGSPFDIPGDGAIYTEQSAFISWPSDSVVNGHVTVASNGNIVVTKNISYASEIDDVLGLIANNYVYLASYVPNELEWRAAVIALNAARRSANCPNEGSYTKERVTFRGSVAMHDSGCMTMFRYRDQYADETLQFLVPPWYPSISGQETSFFREVPPDYVPPLP